MNPAVLARLGRDVWPALVVTGVAALAAAAQVDDLNGKAPLLAGAGLVGAGLALVLLPRVAAVATEGQMPLAPPHAPPTAPGAFAARVALPAPSTPSVGPAAQAEGLAGPVLTPDAVRGVQAFTIAKDGNSDEENEDAMAVSATGGTLVVCDGASSSFGAAAWARTLADALATVSGALSSESLMPLLVRAREAWDARHAGTDVPWWAREGLERGAFSTLVVVRLGTADGQRRWEAAAVGDSCLLQLRWNDGWRVVDAFPLQSAADFNSNPPLVGSRREGLDGLQVRQGVLADGDVVLVVSDAVGEWLLSDVSRSELAASAPIGELQRAVLEARQRHEMVNDDVTVVRVVNPG